MTAIRGIADRVLARSRPEREPARNVLHRTVGLDLLRTIACVLVVVFHMRTLLVVDFGFLNPVIEGGMSGVFVFFALSGYLIYKPFVRGTHELRSYAMKRTARILPGYFVALVALAYITGSPLPAEHPLPYITITSSYHPPLREFLGVAWTLSAEIVFYLLLPLTARLVAGHEIVRLSMIGLASIVLALVHRLVLDGGNIWLLGSFPLVAYSFIPGMLLAVVEVKHPLIFRRLAGSLVMVVGVVLLVVGCLHLADPLALPTAIGTVLVMPWLVERRIPGARFLAFIGGASYALYLWHRDLLTTFGVPGLLIAAVGAAASWALVERPILDWGHRIAARLRRDEPAEPEPGVVRTPIRT
jgi:peptidoglycan/LPS O-acetylase OafA/YrhL